MQPDQEIQHPTSMNPRAMGSDHWYFFRTSPIKLLIPVIKSHFKTYRSPWFPFNRFLTTDHHHLITGNVYLGAIPIPDKEKSQDTPIKGALRVNALTENEERKMGYKDEPSTLNI